MSVRLERIFSFATDTTHTIFYRGHWLKVGTRSRNLPKWAILSAPHLRLRVLVDTRTTAIIRLLKLGVLRGRPITFFFCLPSDRKAASLRGTMTYSSGSCWRQSANMRRTQNTACTSSWQTRKGQSGFVCDPCLDLISEGHMHAGDGTARVKSAP